MVENNQEIIDEFHNYLLKGNIQKAYKLIFDLLSKLKTGLVSSNPEYDIPSNIYHGYLDMTYFPVFTAKLKSHLLKIAVVFNYDEFRFEIWLSANNKKAQKKYWEIIKAKKWLKYKIMESIDNEDSIIEYPVKTQYNFNEIEKLRKDIEKQIVVFIDDVEKFLDSIE